MELMPLDTSIKWSIVRRADRRLRLRLSWPALIAGWLLGLMVSSIAMAVEPRSPLKGGVEHSEHERQREAYCERYAANVDLFEGTLQVMPKAGQGNRDFPAPITDSDIPVVLQRWFGGKPLDDLHGRDSRGLSGAERHRRGERILSSKQHIEQALDSAEGGLDGRGARGLVFWKSRPGERTGHVFNARNDNGHIRFWDAQGPCDYSGMFGPGTEISFYRTN
jgi:hypothetical protein